MATHGASCTSPHLQLSALSGHWPPLLRDSSWGWIFLMAKRKDGWFKSTSMAISEDLPSCYCISSGFTAQFWCLTGRAFKPMDSFWGSLNRTNPKQVPVPCHSPDPSHICGLVHASVGTRWQRYLLYLVTSKHRGLR